MQTNTVNNGGPGAVSIRRRPMDLEDYLDIIRRYRHWLIGFTFAGLVVAVVVAYLWPDTYISRATIRVVPPQVPEKLVPSQTTMEMTARVHEIAQTVMSRSTLAEIVRTKKLYSNDVRESTITDVVEGQMMRDIKIGQVQVLEVVGRGDVTAFEISFAYSERKLAQEVAKELATRFVNLNEINTISRSEQTTAFLDEQLMRAKEDLERIESRLTEFRTRNAGTLPDQLNANVEQLRAAEAQLSSLNEAINRLGQEKMLLEGDLRSLRNQKEELGAVPDQLGTIAKNERLAQLERDIVRTETAINALVQQYTDSHPDVQAQRAQLQALRQKRDELIEQEKGQTPPPVASRVLSLQERQTAAQLELALSRIQSQIGARNVELEERQREQKRMSEIIHQIQARINAVPVSEQQYTELTRDYNLAQNNYQDLNQKKIQSQIATNLQFRRQSERLEILDDASLPLTPASPQRPVIILVGVTVGLMLGLSLISAREVKDMSLKSLKDVRAYSNLPLLGSVPLLESDYVRHKRRRLTWVAWSAATMVGIAMIAGSILYYYTQVKT